MENDNHYTSDTKAIEEKALNYLKNFIEDSQVISQFIADNDKEPCWDGHLYLYSVGHRDKDHLLGRVPIQVKGTEVIKFQTKKWKFPLEKSDLNAYLHEPTFFIVCQVKKNSKERMLFYRDLLPSTVRTLLKDMGKRKTRKTVFHPLTEDLKEFEAQLITFMHNSKRMISFADAKPFTMKDAAKKGIKEFSFTAPAISNDKMKMLKYLSTHDTYLFAKLDTDLDVEVPIDGGPIKLSFLNNIDKDVSVNGRNFYHGYKSIIEDGRMILNIADVLTINLPMDANDKRKAEANMTSKSKFLSSVIHETEFQIAIHDAGKLSLGNIDLEMTNNDPNYIEGLRDKLLIWKELQEVLDKLHVSKPFDLSMVSGEHSRLIDLLINTVGKGETVILPEQKSSLVLLEICNIKLLLWCSATTEGECSLGDFFDETVRIVYKVNDNEDMEASPFSYLQNDNLWLQCDNVNYADVIVSAKAACGRHDYGFVLANYDVLAMIKAADIVIDTDLDKYNSLLDTALGLSDWLVEKDLNHERHLSHFCNKMQIIKRKRAFTDDEVDELKQLFDDEGTDNFFKAGILLLLDDRDGFSSMFEMLSQNEQEMFRGFPIWKFYEQ